MAAGGLTLNKVAYTGSAETADKATVYLDSLAEIPYWVNDAARVTARSTNASIAAQSAGGFATDTYVTDSDILIPSFGMQVRSIFNWRMSASKTGLGTATPIYNIRIGTARTVGGDAAKLTLTGPAQTAIADIGTLNVMVVCRVVSATVGILQGTCWWDHRGTAANTTTSGTGFANDVTGHVETTSGNIDNSAATIKGQYIGLSINGGSSAAWTVTQVQAEADW